MLGSEQADKRDQKKAVPSRDLQLGRINGLVAILINIARSGLFPLLVSWLIVVLLVRRQHPFNLKDNKGGKMNRRIVIPLLALCVTMMVLTSLRAASRTAPEASFFFTTGEPDARIAAASRPESRHKIEIEAADDFILTSHTIIDRATFTGLLFHGGPGEIR